MSTDGSVVTWGHDASGGNSSMVREALSGDAEQIASTDSGFAALKSDGAVVTWVIHQEVAAQLSQNSSQVEFTASQARSMLSLQ